MLKLDKSVQIKYAQVGQKACRGLRMNQGWTRNSPRLYQMVIKQTWVTPTTLWPRARLVSYLTGVQAFQRSEDGDLAEI